jgi:hypothetical protein
MLRLNTETGSEPGLRCGVRKYEPAGYATLEFLGITDSYFVLQVRLGLGFRDKIIVVLTCGLCTSLFKSRSKNGLLQYNISESLTDRRQVLMFLTRFLYRYTCKLHSRILHHQSPTGVGPKNVLCCKVR